MSLSVETSLSTRPYAQIISASLKGISTMVTEKEFNTSPAAHFIRYLVSLPKESKQSF